MPPIINSINKNTVQEKIDNQLVLIHICSQKHMSFLDEILEVLLKFYQYNIYIVESQESIKNANEYVSFVRYKDNTYKKILKTAKYIITDNEFVNINLIKKEQALLFIPCINNNLDMYPTIQKILKMSHFNLFDSKEQMHSILEFYGLKSILAHKNIIYSLKKINILCDFLFQNQKNTIEIFPVSGKKENVLVFIGNIQNESQEKLVEVFLKTLPSDSNVHIISPGMKNYNYIKSLDSNLPYINYFNSHYSLKNKILIKFSYIFPFLTKKVNKLFKRNVQKSFHGLHYNRLIYLLDSTQYTYRELGMLNTHLEYVKLSPMYIGVKCLKKSYAQKEKFLQKNFSLKMTMGNFITEVKHPELCLNNAVNFCMKSLRIQKKCKGYQFKLIIYQDKLFDYKIEKMNLYLNDLLLKCKADYKGDCVRLSFSLSDDEILNLPAQNKFYLQYQGEDGLGFYKDIQYTRRLYINKEFLKSKIFNVNGKTSFYIRQSLKNRTYLTVRLHNKTDSFIENLKINLAYYISKLLRNKNIYLLYEKDSSRYEESASVVYENLIDLKYNNAYFILDRHYPDLNKIQEKYRYNIIYKYTFRHYLYFFISRTFLGSELMVHAMELRIMNKHVLKKIYSTDINNVFLQHGVMYMVSLDSESRKYFSPKKDGKGKFRVVTSSQLEADHFTQLGGYDENQVIVCGLPKYDRNILYPDADKIVIMLTWRVWEYNQATTDFESTPYYKMLQRIVSGINDTYREHLVILPHPLFYKSAMNCEFELKKYMQFNVKYDEILRQTCVLITDYSSIAYDAFYRGSRVIFYWEELESCLEKYGKNTKLMLNKDNVFGDICYSTKDIEQVIDDNYHLEQKKMYQERYNQIVEFHDGKNTKRLIARLKSEKII